MTKTRREVLEIEGRRLLNATAPWVDYRRSLGAAHPMVRIDLARRMDHRLHDYVARALAPYEGPNDGLKAFLVGHIAHTPIPAPTPAERAADRAFVAAAEHRERVMDAARPTERQSAS